MLKLTRVNTLQWKILHILYRKYCLFQNPLKR